MQEEYPHEIRRFADGEAIPDGYVELTEEQFRELDAMTPDERAKWFAARQEEAAPDTFDELRKELRDEIVPVTPAGKIESRLEDMRNRNYREQPLPVHRVHRRQNR